MSPPRSDDTHTLRPRGSDHIQHTCASVPEVAAGAVATAAAEPPAIGRGRWHRRARTVRWVLESAKSMGVTTAATNSSGLSTTMSALPARGALHGDS